jgi:hypothetical protein
MSGLKLDYPTSSVSIPVESTRPSDESATIGVTAVINDDIALAVVNLEFLGGRGGVRNEGFYLTREKARRLAAALLDIVGEAHDDQP